MNAHLTDYILYLKRRTRTIFTAYVGHLDKVSGGHRRMMILIVSFKIKNTPAKVVDAEKSLDFTISILTDKRIYPF